MQGSEKGEEVEINSNGCKYFYVKMYLYFKLDVRREIAPLNNNVNIFLSKGYEKVTLRINKFQLFRAKQIYLFQEINSFFKKIC